jgi:hypothetical protein
VLRRAGDIIRAEGSAIFSRAQGGAILQLAKKCNKAKKNFPQGLKPVESKHFMSELKLRPP